MVWASLGIAGVEDNAQDVVLERREEVLQDTGGGRLAPAQRVLKDDLPGTATMAAAVNDVGLIIEQDILQVRSADRVFLLEDELVLETGLA